MTDQPADRAKPADPAEPSLTPKELKRRQAQDARHAVQDVRREDRQARKQEHHEQVQYRHDLRRSKNPALLHGHRVVNSRDLNRVFNHDAAANKPVRFRRRLVHGVTLTLLAGVVVAGTVLAVMVSRGDLQVGKPASAVSSSPACPGATFDYRPNKDIHVTVYNSTRREGLAGSVAAELKKRGYHVDAVANKSAQYAGTAVVVSGPAGRPGAFNLQRNIAGTDYVADERKDATVDIYLAGAFQHLLPAVKVDQTPGPLSCPRISPTSAASPSLPGPRTTTVP